ncbi:hypothetical protein HELRODRAFT_172925 [Helobdella robusta]|uniref:Uncharacterized protein n=1 Tax=Helobdella robusta TaxID=6412 RepID=T1F652_HELRO|nr:hypothetical protein HELRODRAFT_172925 [Helobdella robusta]ESO03897.1 hypothetical protein HELRODRAFT_172925 [Helobdella robusta]
MARAGLMNIEVAMLRFVGSYEDGRQVGDGGSTEVFQASFFGLLNKDLAIVWYIRISTFTRQLVTRFFQNWTFGYTFKIFCTHSLALKNTAVLRFDGFNLCGLHKKSSSSDVLEFVAFNFSERTNEQPSPTNNHLKCLEIIPQTIQTSQPASDNVQCDLKHIRIAP